MKLSTRGRYGLMAMHHLMISSTDGPVPLKNIAKAENLSEAYLEQLFSALRKEELIKSVRGPQGGYILAKPAEDITIGEILRVLEGDMSLYKHCTELNNECSRIEECPTRDVLTKLQLKIDKVMDSMSLADMSNI
ncbi:MAG: Rrf2 family transcriptional regulator [Tissierellia bacterium]|nr:Rrf2 family transcriptional regulator [Tissierellia bacterium]